MRCFGPKRAGSQTVPMVPRVLYMYDEHKFNVPTQK
jgi:hypothetical protein